MLTEEQMRLETRLDEMLTDRNWRGIVAQEGAALALARDVRVADPGVAGFILSALGNAHYMMGDFSQAIAYHTQHLAIAREVGDRAGEGNAGNNLVLPWKRMAICRPQRAPSCRPSPRISAWSATWARTTTAACRCLRSS